MKFGILLCCLCCLVSCNDVKVANEEPDAARKQAIEKIREQGGTVKESGSGKGSAIMVSFSNTKNTDDLLVENLAFFKELKEPLLLSLADSEVTDEGLATLNQISLLEALWLDRCEQITDDGMKNLSTLTNLNHLSLDDVHLSDNGIEHLKPLKKLNFLTLRNTQITDDGLEHFTELKSLDVLRLSWSKVTDAGVEKLQKALPDCDIAN